MNKECLVTTLRGTATGKNLRKLNEIIFDIVPRPNATKEMGDKVTFNLSVSKDVTINLENARFIDKMGNTQQSPHEKTVTFQNEPIYVQIENENAKIKIRDMFNIIRLGFLPNSFWAPFNSITCKYLPKLATKELFDIPLLHISPSLMLEGDIKDINTKSLTHLSYSNPYKTVDTNAVNLTQKLSGDGSHLLSNLNYFSFSFTNVSFDITKINPNVETIAQFEADMYGDISDLSFPNVSAIYLGSSSFLTPMRVKGKINKLTRKNTNTHILVLRAVPELSGDVGALGQKCIGFSAHPDARFTYTRTLNRLCVMALNGVYLESGLDDYLTDMAKLDMHSDVKSGDASATWKYISVRGERSEASNDAVKTLIAKGFFVEINGETLK